MPDYVIFKKTPSGDWRRLKTELAQATASDAMDAYLANRLVPTAGQFLVIEDNFWPPYDVTVSTTVTVDDVVADSAPEPDDEDEDEH